MLSSEPLFHFPLVFGAGLVDFVLDFQQHFLFAVLTAANGLIDDPGGLLLRRADLPLTDLFPVGNAYPKAYRNQDNAAENGEQYL